MIAMTILEKLWRLNRIFCSSDYDLALSYLQTLIPFHIHEFHSTTHYKGWVIPPKWDLIKGVIKYDGKVIFEVDHPLKIIGLSTPFQGTIPLERLKSHLHYDERDENAIPYHFRQHYRPWDRTWGFCVPKHFYDTLKEGKYEVEIATKESQGSLKVAEHVKKGQFEESFVFVAHLDHPGMANDDLAGVAVGVELFDRLSKIETKFTYRLLLVQEIIGSVFYLDKTKHAPLIESCFLEMLGTKTPLCLQRSRDQKSELEKSILNECSTLKTAPFRSIICNDEAVWESHNIPMCSLSRYPYPEYHSDKDNLSIIKEESLTSACDLLYNAILTLEKKTLIKKQLDGFYAFANPDYNLYIDPGQPAFTKLSKLKPMSLRALMDEIPLLPKYSFAEELALNLDLPLDSVVSYLKRVEEKNFINLI